MRDDQVMRLHESNTRRVFMLLKQFEFLNTRQIAYEELLATPWSRIRAIFDPAWLKRVVDNRQKELLAECAKQLDAAKEKPIIKPIVFTGNGNG